MIDESSIMEHKGVAGGTAAKLGRLSKEGLAAWQSQWNAVAKLLGLA